MLPHMFCLVGSTDDLTLLPALAEAGVDGFQVRDKDASAADLCALVDRVREAVGGAVVVVNDRLDVAMATQADGVHLGAADLPVADARRIAPDLVIGATCRTPDQVRLARDAGADYAGLGPIHATDSKPGLPAPLGLDAVREAARVGLPLVGIGGVDAARAADVRAAGAHAVAVIGGIWRQPDPVAAAKELVRAVR